LEDGSNNNRSSGLCGFNRTEDVISNTQFEIQPLEKIDRDDVNPIMHLPICRSGGDVGYAGLVSKPVRKRPHSDAEFQRAYPRVENPVTCAVIDVVDFVSGGYSPETQEARIRKC
jgi:hypothetical protein